MREQPLLSGQSNTSDETVISVQPRSDFVLKILLMFRVGKDLASEYDRRFSQRASIERCMEIFFRTNAAEGESETAGPAAAKWR